MLPQSEKKDGLQKGNSAAYNGIGFEAFSSELEDRQLIDQNGAYEHESFCRVRSNVNALIRGESDPAILISRLRLIRPLMQGHLPQKLSVPSMLPLPSSPNGNTATSLCLHHRWSFTCSSEQIMPEAKMRPLG